MKTKLLLALAISALAGCGGSSSGSDGRQGSSGLNALVNISEEASGANCANGGQKIESGIDQNENATLDAEEVTSVQYICNGQDGNNGQNGQDGQDGEDAPLPLAVSISQPSATEESGQLTFNISLSEAQSEDLAFTYGTLNVTAMAGSDYEAVSGSLTFAPGEITKSLTVQIQDDADYECDEHFLLQLNTGSDQYSAFGVITHGSDTAPELSFVAKESEVNENAGQAEIHVQLAAPSCQDATINVAYSNVTTSDGDYTKVDSFVVAAGSTTASFLLPIVDDQINENRERVQLTLSSSDEVSVKAESHELSILPVTAKLFGGFTQMCAQSQDGLLKCWGNGNDYQFANGSDEEYGWKYGEATKVAHACHSETETRLVNTFEYAPGNGTTCDAYGGVGYDYGYDDDGNGILDSGEITTSRDDCNTETETYMIMLPEQAPNLVNCPYGGQNIFVGIDENSDGELQLTDMGENILPANFGDLNLVDLGLGYEFSCGLFDDQTTRCWGENDYGQLGLEWNPADVGKEHAGDDISELGNNLPIVNLGADRYAVDIAVGYRFACAILDTGQVKCWGRNDEGQLGQGDTINRGEAVGTMGDDLLAVDLGLDPSDQPYTAKQIEAGEEYVCAILNNDQLKCWGYNSYGNLGYDDMEDRGDDADEMGNNLPFVNVGTDRSVTDLYIGYATTCAVLDNDSVKCWGSNISGELGLGSEDRKWGNGEVDYIDYKCSTESQAMLADVATTLDGCSTGKDSHIVTWGLDTDGNGLLEGAERSNNRTFCDGEYLTLHLDVVTVAAGGDQCTDHGGIAYRRGHDHDDNDAFDSEMGEALPALNFGTGAAIRNMNGGYDFTCANFTDNSFKCWGAGEYGPIGLDTEEDYGDDPGETLDMANPDMNGATVIQTAGRGYVNCVLLDTAEVKCWGYSEYGDAGIPDFYDEEVGDGDRVAEMGANLPSLELY